MKLREILSATVNALFRVSSQQEWKQNKQKQTGAVFFGIRKTWRKGKTSFVENKNKMKWNKNYILAYTLTYMLLFLYLIHFVLISFYFFFKFYLFCTCIFIFDKKNITNLFLKFKQQVRVFIQICSCINNW